jgi:VWFA-related protein
MPALLAASLTGPDPAKVSAEERQPIVISPLVETTTSEAVLIEVFANDAKGRPIKDLQVSDLTLKIDMKSPPASIFSLEYVEFGATPGEAGVPPASPEGPAPAEDSDAGGTTGPTAVAARGPGDYPRRFLLFFEDSVSSPHALRMARQAAEQLVSRPGAAGDQFALVAYDQKRKLHVLHEFSSDRTSLLAALRKSEDDRMRYSDYFQELEDRKQQMNYANRDAGMAGVAVSGGAASAQASSLAKSYAQEDYSRMRHLVEAIETLIDGLAPWPGYKAIVFMGDGIPQNTGNMYGMDDSRHDLKPALGDLAYAASASNVTLHAVETSGLVAGDSKGMALASRRSNALASLALGTGGVSVDSNDLVGALGHVEESTRGYYVLTYIPQGPPDGRTHSIDLRSKRKGVTLRYRRTFTRLLPQDARTRAIQAAFLSPELHSELGLDLSAIAGPVGSKGQVVDVVIYVPPGRALFVPQPGGAVAHLEVGLVALDAEGRETLRTARKVVLTVDVARVQPQGPLALDFFSRVMLPAGSQTLTAVVADMQSGSLGAARVAIAPPPAAGASILGLSLYSVEERSLWVEVESGAKTSDAASSVSYTVGPALRTRFAPGEKVRCGFKTASSRASGTSPLRLAIDRQGTVVKVHPIEAAAGASQADGTTVNASLTLDGLAAGEYALRVDELLDAGPSELGRLNFHVLPKQQR